ncbi:hypothetical protein PPYR_01238 [Photinus pyralis]|uniref:DUF4806 domain-containing protein n=1 Tax=Photinus pyralis TaxID=7054 RepID=A0A5N4B413_PHOPY|nr:hypothetical protein PPYR_01238 [Photinus pyralis]
MAKNGTPPESDWLQVPITVVKENYASFDRCMKDAIRFDRGGGRSISASETEERGAGRRISRVRKRSPSIESDSTEEYPEPPRKKTPRTSPRECTWLAEHHQYQIYVEEPGPGSDEDTYAFPLQSLDDVNTFEGRLKDKDFFMKILQHLLQNVEKTNISKTARSTLKQLMATSVAQKFSWKGQQRRDQAESKECFSTLQMATLIYKCVKTVWPNETEIKRKIEATLSTFLSQQGSIYLKRSSTGTAPADSNDQLSKVQ